MSSQTGMKRRCWVHDYCAPCFYMITVVTEPRRNCLSRLEMRKQGAASATEPGAASATEPGGASGAGAGEGGAPYLTLSPVGQVVREAWRRTTSVYPGVEACECVVMPDHFHGILWVKERQERHVGHVVKAFKRVCERECRSKGLLLPPNPSKGLLVPPNPSKGLILAEGHGPVVGAAPAATSSSLWEEGYQDSILLRRGQLKAMANYIADNPRRLAIKCARPDLFTVVRKLAVAPGRACPAIGNRFLLDYPIRLQVQISRSISPEALADKKEELLYASAHGVVLVSPCISPGEKEIARATLAADRPLIVVLANGFPPHYKPPGRYFDACASGRLLMLAPFPYHREKRTITREQCLALNEWAREMQEQGAAPATEPEQGAAPATEPE